jgi:outer membrane lipoprotein-sorting protein
MIRSILNPPNIFNSNLYNKKMKKTFIYSLLFIGTIANTFAQKDAEAKVILNAMSAKYHAYNIVKSTFTFAIEDIQAKTTTSQNGVLVVQAKTNKYHLTLYSSELDNKSAVAQEIISDGKSQWTYTHKDKEVQLSTVDNTGESFNPAQMFTLYEKGYKYIYTDDIKINGKVYQVIDLTPEDDKKEFFKVRLTIDKVKKQLYSALIFDKSGMRFTYTITGFTPNVAVPETTFSFDKKANPGVEVVDLR